jgi:hypothetical protein
MEKIIKTIIENKIRNMLEIISKNYPSQFKKEYIDIELKYIIKHINIKSYVKYKESLIQLPLPIPISTQVNKPKRIMLKNNPIYNIIHNPIHNPIHNQYQTKTNQFKKIKVKSFKKKIQKKIQKKEIKKKKQIKQITQEERCCARIWNNDIIEKKTMSKVNEIANEFKVFDFKDINIKQFDKKYTIGLQCKKIKYKDNIYCKLHTQHLIHGNYKDIPSQELCYHFMKDGKYL